MRTIDAAKGYWPEILKKMGVDSNYLNGKHTACPICGQGKDTFRFDDKNGSGSYFCGKCGAGYGINFVMNLLNLSFAGAAKQVDEIIRNEPVQKTQKSKPRDPRWLLRLITKGLHPIIGTEAEKYLHDRGLEIISNEMSFHPGLDYWEIDNQGTPVKRGNFSAMVAPIISPDGQPLTYHITYLSNGRKANVESPKKIMTPIEPIKGGAIRLFQPTESLGIAEGIETALAVHQHYKIPVWATVSANGMESIVLPDEIRKVSIFSDNDKSYAGQKAAFILANRLRIKGIKVEVLTPLKPGTDFLDELEQS